MVPQIAVRSGDALTASADALVMPVFAGEGPAGGLDAKFDGQLGPTMAAAKFTGKRGELLASATFGRLPARTNRGRCC